MKRLTIFIIICFIFSTSIFANIEKNEKPFVIPELKHKEIKSVNMQKYEYLLLKTTFDMLFIPKFA